MVHIQASTSQTEKCKRLGNTPREKRKWGTGQSLAGGHGSKGRKEVGG